MNADVALDYLDFVAERHRVWEARQRGDAQPWTENPILASRKFTNVFRVLDPGSQYVFELASDEPTETLMRLFLYRHTNLPGAWRAYHAEFGELPGLGELEQLRAFWQAYRAEGGKVFSGAYMVYPQSSVPGTDKVDSVIETTRRLFVDERIDEDFICADTQAERFAVLRRNKGVADFMSMQILTDYGYTSHGEDVEDEFVVAGPGSKRGAALVWPELEARRVIEWAQSAVHADPEGPVLRGRKPSLMDIQNTFCEYGKYARYAARSVSTEQPYRPAHPGVQSEPVLPDHWNR